jgi:hypothetical protein
MIEDRLSETSQVAGNGWSAANRRRLAAWLGAALASLLMLMAPALWNGFPLLQYDTGGYLARWHEGTLYISRSVAYGLLLNLGTMPDFWPVVIVQSVLTVWVLALVLRVHGLGRPLILPVTVGILSVATALPWIAGILLTDIFAGLAVLALILTMLHWRALRRVECIGLCLLAGYGGATHSATLAVLLGLVMTAALMRIHCRRLVPLAGLCTGLAAIVLSVAIVLVANFAVAGRLAWTPGGYALSFGRMLQDGIVTRYLADHCPDARLRLCAHRHELPGDADEFFWSSDLFDRLGRFEGLSSEMETIARESLAAYPLMQARAAAAAFARQLVSVRTGDGVVHWIWNTYGMMELHTPSVVPAMEAARQQRAELGFSAINRLHVPVALASLALLPAVMLLGRRRGFADLGLLAAAVAVAILGNAVVCGVFANPHDRYGARMVWLATLVVAMLPWRIWSRSGAR